MLVVDCNVTKGADKAPAGRTGNHRLFTGVIEASGLIIQLQGIAGAAGGKFPAQGRIKNTLPKTNRPHIPEVILGVGAIRNARRR